MRPGARARGATAVVAALLCALAAGFSGASPPSRTSTPACARSGIGQDSYCTVHGLRLHYVDWGGSGPTVVLLTGLGDSARIFDDFAPLLARGHRVIGLTRRGYGESAAPSDANYTNSALVGDILGLLDALGIARASFVGHSIAGGELATLGADYPERVERLVYVDAAYDRTQAPDLMAHVPPLPPPSAAARTDLDTFTRWREGALGLQLPAVRHDLAQVMVPSTAGLVPRTPADVGAAVLAGDIGSKPRWAAIDAPSLAFFTSKDVSDQVPEDATTAQRAAFVAYSIKVLRPWMLRAQADFIERSRCAVAIEVPHSTHYLFLERPDWTAQTILEFLSSADPCRWQGMLGTPTGSN